MNATFGRYGQTTKSFTKSDLQQAYRAGRQLEHTGQPVAYDYVAPGIESTPADNIQAQIIEVPTSDVQAQIVETPVGEVPHWSDLLGEPETAPAFQPITPALTPQEQVVRTHIVPMVQEQKMDVLTLVIGGMAIAAFALGIGAAFGRR